MTRFQIFVFAIGLSSQANGQIQFRHHFVDEDGPAGNAWASLALADWDRDGDLDIITGKSKHGGGERRVVWYQNRGGLENWSEPLVLKNGMTTGCGSAIFDADGDGWLDYFAGRLVLNPGGNHHTKQGTSPEWDFGNRIHDLEAADFNGDGRPEVVANIQHSDKPGLYLFRTALDSSLPWTMERIHPVGMFRPNRENYGSVHAAVSPRGIGDLDGDGDLDIAYLGAWCENADGKGVDWKIHENIDFRPKGPWASAVRCWIADIDQDGHNDIVQSVCDSPKALVVWIRNAHGDGTRWEINTLPDDRKSPGDFHSLGVGDFDLDGDLDIYVDEMEHLHLRSRPPQMLVWENIDGKGSEWSMRVIMTGLGGHQAQVADLDGDGDLDIVTRPYTAKGNSNGGRMHLSILENLTRSKEAKGEQDAAEQPATSP